MLRITELTCRYFLTFILIEWSRQFLGLPWWLSGKESTCQADVGSIPGSGKFPGEGNDNPVQHSCLGNPTDRGAWQATAQGVAESDKIEVT